jgi:glycosyltransferase
LKISIITLTCNSIATIKKTIESINNQTYKNVQKIWIDNQSTDGTLEFLKKSKDKNTILISEKDDGICEAFNKGLRKSSGDIVGFLHSDDIFYSNETLDLICSSFKKYDANLSYGDLEYITNKNYVLRKWISDTNNNCVRNNYYFKKKLLRGWMAPHPTIYIKKNYQEEIGFFDSKYKISFDYDFIIRAFSNIKLKSIYIPSILVKMKTGGVSNKSIKNIVLKMKEDYKIIKKNRQGGLVTLILKNISKIYQFFI